MISIKDFDSNLLKLDKKSLNKTLKLHSMTIVIRSVFEEHGKFYPHIHLDQVFV